MRSVRLAVLGLTLFAAACAAGGASGEGGTRRNPNLITIQELASFEAATAHEAVQSLRPRWMNRRGGASPRVFVNGAQQGSSGLDVLRNYRADMIREIRFIDPPDATMRWGTGFSAGVIDLILR